MAGDLERKAALLGTKYSKPGINPNLVTRQRLHDKLNESLKNKLTTVVAPAGYEKTTAVLEWLGGISKDAEYVFSSLDLLKANVISIFWLTDFRRSRQILYSFWMTFT